MKNAVRYQDMPVSLRFSRTAKQSASGTAIGAFTYKVLSVAPAKVVGTPPDPASRFPEGLAERVLAAARKRTEVPLTLEELTEHWQDPKDLRMADLEAHRRARVLRFTGARFSQDAHISSEEFVVLLKLALAYADALGARSTSSRQ